MEEKYGIHFTEELLTAPGFGPMTREVMDTVQSVLDMNDPVGLAAGYYTDRLPIVCASRFCGWGSGVRGNLSRSRGRRPWIALPANGCASGTNTARDLVMSTMPPA